MDSETPKKHYSPHKRTRIVTAYDLGVSPKEIALKEGIPAGSVRGIASRYSIAYRKAHKVRHVLVGQLCFLNAKKDV